KHDYRRLGVGTKLVDLAVEWFGVKEIDRIQLSVAALNQTGIDFWNKYGFKELSYRMNMLI
ncbi:MAG: GNAT family N-acetyltransferase, partial [Promethearchaeota archaeon]